MNESTKHRMDQLFLSLKDRERWLVGIESAAYLAVILTALLGNIVLILAIYKTGTLRNSQNYLLVSLAATDILNAVSCMPLTLAALITGKWPFEDFVCQLQGSFWTICTGVSLLTLGLIAFNRYVKIVRSASLYQKIFTRRNVWISIAISWISSVFLSSSVFLVDKTAFSFHPGKSLCFFKHLNVTNRLGIYNTILYVILTSVAFSMIFFCYFKVLRKIRAHYAQVRNSSLQNRECAAFAEEIRITTMLFVTLLAVCISWSPSVIIDFYELFGNGQFMFKRQLYLLNVFTFQSSSAVNPFIYGLMNREFREGYRRVLYCRDG